ncbi:hypothetical protein [Rhodobacter capsulatus]
MSRRKRLDDILQLLTVLIVIVALPIGTALWVLGIYAMVVQQ